LAKVSRSTRERSSKHSKLFSQGIYRLNNVTFNDDFIPVQTELNIYCEVKAVGKVQGAKKNVDLWFASAVIEFKPNSQIKVVNGTGNLFQGIVIRSRKQ
jgi:hypothetical protein